MHLCIPVILQRKITLPQAISLREIRKLQAIFGGTDKSVPYG